MAREDAMVGTHLLRREAILLKGRESRHGDGWLYGLGVVF